MGRIASWEMLLMGLIWLVTVTIRLCSAQKLSLDFTSPPEKAIVFDFLSQKEEHFS
jgi:hypothetical protein